MKNLLRIEMVERLQKAMEMMVEHNYEFTTTSRFKHLHNLVKDGHTLKSPLRKADLLEIAEEIKKNLV